MLVSRIGSQGIAFVPFSEDSIRNVPCIRTKIPAILVSRNSPHNLPATPSAYVPNPHYPLVSRNSSQDIASTSFTCGPTRNVSSIRTKIPASPRLSQVLASTSITQYSPYRKYTPPASPTSLTTLPSRLRLYNQTLTLTHGKSHIPHLNPAHTST
ncbi:hypothetical protein BC629DRAFT_1522071 [Irpex lacteus]|nr:hypothetical protein BC629DRAFT_1522071 [Irpex lacteus]